MKRNVENDALIALAIAMATGNASEGLEAVQKSNQENAADNCMLPKKMEPSKEAFEAVGFSFEDVGDKVLIKAKLPNGWRMEGEGYWHTFYDENGEERGSSFYKGAFWDRTGYMRLKKK